jgi:hypothetical protein
MKKFTLIVALVAAVAVASFAPTLKAQELGNGFVITKKQIHSTTKTTVTPVAQSVTLYEIVITTSNAGTAWTLNVQDKQGTPAILVSALALATSQNPLVLNFGPTGVRMTGGIDVTTGGTTAGVADFWLDYK